MESKIIKSETLTLDEASYDAIIAGALVANAPAMFRNDDDKHIWEQAAISVMAESKASVAAAITAADILLRAYQARDSRLRGYGTE